MKKFKKVLLLIGIFAIAFVAGNTVKYYLDMWKADRAIKSFQSAIDAIYKNDTYGGKTPEETFDLYLAALKKGDLELASKYFSLYRRSNQLDFLKKLKDSDELSIYIDELSSIDTSTWDKKTTGSQVLIKYNGHRDTIRTIEAFDENWKVVEEELPTGNFTATLTMDQVDSIWKIYSL